MCAFPQGCLLPVRCFSLFCSFPSRRRLQPLMQWEGDAAVCQVTCPPGIPAAKECGGGTLGIGWSCDPPWTPDPRPQIWPPAFVQPLRPRLFPGRGGWICNFTAACACAGVASAGFSRIAGAESSCLRIQQSSMPENGSNLPWQMGILERLRVGVEDS